MPKKKTVDELVGAIVNAEGSLSIARKSFSMDWVVRIPGTDNIEVATSLIIALRRLANKLGVEE